MEKKKPTCEELFVQAVQQKSKVFLSIFLATHDRRVCSVLLQGSVNVIWHEGLADAVFVARGFPVFEPRLLDHHKLVNKVNPAKKRKKEKGFQGSEID